MSAATRVPLELARAIAEELLWMLRPYCARVVIAGSIRRARPEVGDIDLVLEPSFRQVVDLFGQDTGEQHNLLDAQMDAMLADGTISARLDRNGRRAWGSQLKRATYRAMPVDVQSVIDPTTWGAWLLIRTGPADFNKRIVTPRSQGGRLPSGFQFRDGFRLYRHGGRVETPTERSVFAALGLPYIEPEERI